MFIVYGTCFVHVFMFVIVCCVWCDIGVFIVMIMCVLLPYVDVIVVFVVVFSVMFIVSVFIVYCLCVMVVVIVCCICVFCVLWYVPRNGQQCVNMTYMCNNTISNNTPYTPHFNSTMNAGNQHIQHEQ